MSGDGSGESKESAVKRSGEFHLPCSFNPESPEVLSMMEQVNQGRSTPVYEFAQGQVDYGADQETPPRIYLVKRNGKREEWTGDAFDHEDVIAVEFENAGPGLTPEDTVIIRHGGGPDTKGKHGRGTSVTLTYLTSQGMPVDVESNLRGQGWSATSALEKTETGLTSTLVMNGGWDGGESNKTLFRVRKPNEQFLGQLDHFSNQFLPANAKYPDALLVEKDPNAPKLVVNQSVGNGRVQCLRGVVRWSKPEGNVYVDGLKVSHYRTFLFPWAFEGFRKELYPFKVQRSHDSGSVDSGGDPSVLVHIALRSCTDVSLFEKLLEVAMQKSGELPGELKSPVAEIPDKLSGFSPATLQVLKNLWQGKQGSDVLIARDQQMVDRLTKKSSEKKVLVVRGEMYEWLKQAGVTTAEGVLNIDKADSFESNENIQVEYAKDPDRLEKLFEEAGNALADVRLLQQDGEQVVELRFPYGIASDADFYDRNKPGAQWVRVAAVIASAEKLGMEIVAYVGDQKTTLTITTGSVYGKEGTYRSFMTTESGQTKESPFEGPNGGTIVTLTGEALQALNPPPSQAEILEERANKARQEVIEARKRIKDALPRLNKKAASSNNEKQANTGLVLSRRDLLLGGSALVGVTAAGLVLEKSGLLDPYFARGTEMLDGMSHQEFLPNPSMHEAIGSGVSSLGVHRIDFDKRQEAQAGRKKITLESGVASRGTDGYYREFTGMQLTQTHFGGRAEWISSERYVRYPVATDAPRDFLTRTTRPINGEARLSIRQGEVVVAAVSTDGKPIEILRDPHLGNFVIRGFSEEVAIYTQADTEGPELRDQPIDQEQQEIVDPKDLEPHWQLVIATLRADRNLDARKKAAILLAEWGDKYYYSDRTGLDEQVSGYSIKAISAKIINTQEGICNTSATGYVALLRSVGVSARTVSGWHIDAGSGGPHMWTEFWDGDSWVLVESLYGSETDPDFAERESLAARLSSKNPSDSTSPIRGIDSDATGAFLAGEKAAVDQYRDDLAHMDAHEVSTADQPIAYVKEAAKATGWAAIGAGVMKLFDRFTSHKTESDEDDV